MTDGHVLRSRSSFPFPGGSAFRKGDVIGCGYVPGRQTIFFTRNGQFIETAFRGIERCTTYRACVGFNGPNDAVSISFGPDFKYSTAVSLIELQPPPVLIPPCDYTTGRIRPTPGECTFDANPACTGSPSFSFGCEHRWCESCLVFYYKIKVGQTKQAFVCGQRRVPPRSYKPNCEKSLENLFDFVLSPGVVKEVHEAVRSITPTPALPYIRTTLGLTHRLFSVCDDMT